MHLQVDLLNNTTLLLYGFTGDVNNTAKLINVYTSHRSLSYRNNSGVLFHTEGSASFGGESMTSGSRGF